jgi:predicted ATPase
MHRGWGAPELAELYCRARELASALNRPRALLFALWGQFTENWAQADLKQAQSLAAALRELGDSIRDVPMQVMGCDAGGLTCFHLGEFTAAKANLEKGLALYEPAHRACYSELLSHDAGVFVRLHLSWVLACLGHLDQALVHNNAALDEARRLSHPPTLAAALSTAFLIGWFVGLEPGSLMRCADEVLPLASKHGLGLYRAAAMIWRGWCLSGLQRADEGIPLLVAGVAGMNELGYTVFKPRELTLLGDAYRIAGQWQAALAQLAEARRVAEETEARWCQAETLRLTGDVLAAMGDPFGAEASYGDAIALAQQQSGRLWELRAAMSLARLWREEGKRAEARHLLTPPCVWFTEGLGTPILQEAKALLDGLGADPSAGMGDGVAPAPPSSRNVIYGSA